METALPAMLFAAIGITVGLAGAVQLAVTIWQNARRKKGSKDT